MQLIVPGAWDGTRRIDMPSAKGVDSEGTVWTGPQEWRNPYTGQTLTVYDRRRTTPREGLVEQKMAVRVDGSAIDRIYDSRFGGLACDQEAKIPARRLEARRSASARPSDLHLFAGPWTRRPHSSMMASDRLPP